ncbi:MAG: hypothetical protein OXL41_15510 [Nitrospinae bacterium]|nr:hypothetical protein [Nitrospinota bacterium]
MPEQVHKISITKKIDLNSGNSLKALERFTKAAGQARIATEKLNAQTRESRSALQKSSRAFMLSTKRLQGVGASSTEAAVGMNSLWRNAERAGAQLASGPLARGLDEVKAKTAALPASFRIAGRAVTDFASASERTLTRFFSDALSGKIDSAKDLFSDLKNHAINMVRNAAAEMASTQFIKPAVGALQDLGLNLLGDVGKGLLGVFGFSKGGLVKKPTLGVIGEAGPELVVPLAKIGGEAGLMRLFQSVSELEAANRIGGTAIATAAGAKASGDLAARIAATKAAAALRVAFSALDFLKGPKTLKTGANLAINVAGALPALAGATGLAAFGPAAGAFLLTDVLFNKGGAIKQVLSFLGFKGFRSRATPFTRGIANLAQAAGLYLALDRFRQTGVAEEAKNLQLPQAVYQGKMSVDPPLLEKAGLTFQLIQRAAGKAGISPQEGVKRYFGEGLYSSYLGALPVLIDEGDAAGRFVKRSALRLVGEAGPEHIMNVNHPQSIDFFQRGVRPIIRDAIRDETGAGGDTHVYHIHIEGNLSDNRMLEKLSRKLEDINRRRRRYGQA